MTNWYVQILPLFSSNFASIFCIKKALKNQGFWAGVVGIEPTSGVLETLILPMNYAPMYFWHAYIYTIFVKGCQQNKHIKFRKCIRKLLAYTIEFWYNDFCYADVAELADALDLGSSVPDVQVRFLSSALKFTEGYLEF